MIPWFHVEITTGVFDLRSGGFLPKTESELKYNKLPNADNRIKFLRVVMEIVFLILM